MAEVSPSRADGANAGTTERAGIAAICLTGRRSVVPLALVNQPVVLAGVRLDRLRSCFRRGLDPWRAVDGLGAQPASAVISGCPLKA
jgi:hypothetical protein